MNTNDTITLETFYKQFGLRSYRKGETLIRSDDNPQGIFYLISGYIRQYTISKGGTELTLHILKPVSYFPMVWAINGTPNVYNFEALTTVEVRRAPRDEIVTFIKDKPGIIFSLMSELLESYEETLKRVEHLVFSDAYRRVVSVLIYIASHFGTINGTEIAIGNKFTHQDIATLVGVARETTSIEMAKLEKKGLLKYYQRNIIIENINKLELELLSN